LKRGHFNERINIADNSISLNSPATPAETLCNSMKTSEKTIITPPVFFSWQILVCLAAALLAISSAHAATYDWVASSGAGNLTGTNSNWSGNTTVP